MARSNLCRTVLFFILFCLPMPMGAAGAAMPQALRESTLEPLPSDPWAMKPSDLRRALSNNIAPPERRMPETQLPPLPPQEQGTIRRMKIPAGDKVAALTFDMCELATITTGYDARIINFLRSERIPATLFMGGKWMRTHAERTRQLMAEPLFEIANHAWSHGNFGIMRPEQMREQVLWTQAQYELLREETLRRARAERRPAPDIPPVPRLFRLPYGRCTDQALELLADLGLRVIQWDVVAEGMTDNGRPGLGHRVAQQVRPGSILLFHANLVPENSAALLEETVKELRRQGWRFVTVGELLRLGEPQRTHDGYFNKPGDNKALDAKFGVDGTGRRR